MSTYVSKSSNFRIMLRHGIPSEPITGRNAIPGLSVKFEGGILKVPEAGLGGETQEKVESMVEAHPRFGTEFIRVEDGQRDPYGHSRLPVEPEHNIVNLEFGHIGKNLNPRKAFTDPQMEMMKAMAAEMAKSIVKDVFASIEKEKSKDKEIGEAPEGTGRAPALDPVPEASEKPAKAPKKAKATEVTE